MLKIAIVDDHKLFAQSLEILINSFEGYEVIYHAHHGDDLIARIKSHPVIPDLILLDVNMPVRNGLETMTWLQDQKTPTLVLALSMDDHEDTIIQMLHNGARGYILKDINPNELKDAMDNVTQKGFHYSEKVTHTLLSALQDKSDNKLNLKDREIEFLKLACTERTYKQIAQEMYLSPKTIDGYREVLFQKLNVKSRIGLVLYAIEMNIVKIK